MKFILSPLFVEFVEILSTQTCSSIATHQFHKLCDISFRKLVLLASFGLMDRVHHAMELCQIQLIVLVFVVGIKDKVQLVS